MDLYFTDQGDLAVSPRGDLALTESPFRDDVQQAYIRVMTDAGDFTIYPDLGATLSDLYGKPNSPQTAEVGKQLISAALDREGRFNGKPYLIEAVPVGPQAIRFDLRVFSGNKQSIRLSVEQSLGI